MRKKLSPPSGNGKLASLMAQFDDIKDRFWSTSDLAERAALLKETHSILLETSALVQQHVDESSSHCQRITREYGKLIARVNHRPQT